MQRQFFGLQQTRSQVLTLARPFTNYNALKKRMSDPTFGKCATAPWQPPNAVFVVVWTILYIFYGLTLYRARNSPAIGLLWLGLALNLLWAPLFIYNAKLGLAIIVLMIIIAYYSYNKLKNNPSEAVFIQVYAAWLVFALTLNSYIAIKCKK